MKFLKKSQISVLFFLTIVISILSAEITPKGKKLCDENYDFFKKAGIKPQTQSLVASDTNGLPYNIIIRNEKSEEEPKLVYIFSGDEIYGRQEIIVSLANYLKENIANSDIVISYGDRYSDNFLEHEVIRGYKVYMNSLNTNQENTIIITKLTDEKNAVITGSEMLSAPSWLAKTVLKGFTDSSVLKKLHIFYISQLSKASFNIEPSLHVFLENGFPAISTNISTKTNDTDKIAEILNNITENYQARNSKHQDNNFFILRIHKFLLLLSEYSIVRILIVLIFINLMIMYIFGFVKQNLQSELWKSIIRSYILPITIALNLFSFFLGKSVYDILIASNGIKTAYGILVFQTGTALFLNSLYFIIEIIFHKKYDAKSIDVVIFISTLINQFLFAIIDISTFPFFFLFCGISLLSLLLKYNRWHIVLIVLMILAFVPYITRLYVVSDFDSLTSYLYTNPLVFISVSVLILPLEIMWFRILTRFNNLYNTKRKTLIFTTFISYASFMVILITLNVIFFRNKTPEKPSIIEIEDTNKTIQISSSETMIFDDVIRNLTVEFSQQPYICEIIVKSPQSNPIEYSSSDYLILDENSALFKIPYYPPENLVFNYGASDYESTVYVKAYYMEDRGVIVRHAELQIEGKK